MKNIEASGLFANDGNPIPLEGVEIDGEVLGGHTRLKIRQRYKNGEARPVEAVYTFPLPSDATLVGFAMTCDGRRVEGVVKEREQAFKDYDDAMVAGHGAALVEQERPNIFTASVGNLLPGETTVVEIEIVQRVRADEGSLRVMIPTLVAPRYIPGDAQGDRTGHGWADPTTAVPDADRITPKIAGTVPYGLRLSLVLDLGRDVEVESPSHSIQVSEERGLKRVSFTQAEVALDRDVVLCVRGVTPEPLTTVVTHRDKTDSIFALTVVPDLAGAPSTTRQNVVFVIDTSGSMGGLSIEQARAALRLCLRHLREGDSFNVIEFNSSHRAFAKDPVPFTQKTLSAVDAWVSALQATGGTEVLRPMIDAVEMAPDGVVILLTDGEVGNEDQVVREVIAKRKRTRIYSFGIGTNVSDVMLRELAKQTGGAVELVYPGERIDEKVVATFARAVAPRVTDVTVTWSGVQVGELAPAELPALIDGEPWVLLGKIDGGLSGHAELRGKLGGAPFLVKVPVDFSEPASHPMLTKLWASERIRDLESQTLAGRRADRMKERIIELGVRYGVQSKYTSFVVVETRTGDRRTSGPAETRVIPVNMPHGWDMFDAKDADKTPAVAGKQMQFGAANHRSTKTGIVYRPPGGMPMPSVPAPAPAMPVGGMGSGSGAMKPYEAKTQMAPTQAPQSKAPANPISAAIGAVAKGAAGIASGMKGMFGRKKADTSAADGVDAAAPAKLAAPQKTMMLAMGNIEKPEPTAEEADPVVALLGRQLASGLWGGASDDEVTQAKATAAALVELLGYGVTTMHALHGAQVKKAVEALLLIAGRVAAKDAAVAEMALGVAWLVASGRRTRGQIETLVGGTPALAALKAALGDEAKVRARVHTK